MAARIPDCELQIYPRAGHVLAVQRPESLDAVRDFLGRHDGRLELTHPAGRPHRPEAS